MDTSGPLPLLTGTDSLATLPEYSTAMKNALVGPWTRIPYVPGNGWADYVGGGQYRAGLWARLNADNIQFSGMIRAGAVGSIIAAIPVQFRPPYNGFYDGWTGAPAKLQVDPQNTAHGCALSYTAGASPAGFLNFNFSVPRR